MEKLIDRYNNYLPISPEAVDYFGSRYPDQSRLFCIFNEYARNGRILISGKGKLYWRHAEDIFWETGVNTQSQLMAFDVNESVSIMANIASGVNEPTLNEWKIVLRNFEAS